MNIRKTLQASAFRFIVLNLVGKAVLHFLLKNWFVDSLEEHFKNFTKMLNSSIFSFIILNIFKKGILLQLQTYVWKK